MQARNLTAFFSVCTFNSPEKGPYVETYLNVVGNSVKVAKDMKGKFQSKIEVELTFSQGDQVKYHDKYNLLGPELADTVAFRQDFIDQQRILLPNGDYNLELKITDLFAPDQSFKSKRPVKVDFPLGILSISDIELLESYNKATEENKFTKSGLSIVPFVLDYYPQGITSIKLYAEIYNTMNVLNTDPFVINYYISGHQNKYIANNLAGFKRETPKEVSVILAELPIQDLVTGNYNLTIEVRNKNNNLLASKQAFFQRSNSKPLPQAVSDIKSLDIANTFVAAINNIDTMNEYIACLRPISGRMEVDFAVNQLQIADLKYMQQFFYDFWIRRNANAPEEEWKKYLAEVRKVNATFSTRIDKGYATDRGRVYLQYGPPKTIVREENEPSAYPYEIWHYYEMGNQSNRKFLFYCREPASNNYTLLHSTATGEVYNSHWKTDLHGRMTQYGSDIDNTSAPIHSGGKAEEAFEMPK